MNSQSPSGVIPDGGNKCKHMVRTANPSTFSSLEVGMRIQVRIWNAPEAISSSKTHLPLSFALRSFLPILIPSSCYAFSSSHVWKWELDYKETWAPKNWCFRTVVLEKTLESPLDSKEIKPVHPKGNQSWIFIGRTDAEAETPILWPPHMKN